jgi:hypothetical protein
MHSANNAALAANSAKPRAKSINSVLMAISAQEFVPLQSEYLFHDRSPLPGVTVAEEARGLRDSDHVLELFGQSSTSNAAVFFGTPRSADFLLGGKLHSMVDLI